MRSASKLRPGHALVALEVLLAPACTALVGTLVGAPLAAVALCLPQVSAAAWLERTRSGVLVSLAGTAGWYLPLLRSQPTRFEHVDHTSVILGTVVCLGFAMITGRLRRVVARARLAVESDDLTKLLNKRGFQTRLEAESNRSLRTGRPLAVAFLDCDNFKTVNDTLGHATGDQLLITMARTLKRNVRSYDCVARMGGDEFAILFPEMPHHKAQSATDRLMETVRTALRAHDWDVTVSVGVVVFERPEPVPEMLAAADAEMYAVKRSGKARVQIRVVNPPSAGDSSPAA
jgi:diguanylate cyclase (GGDEF)-like protein